MKIAIIGAGFCGLAVAWHLLNHSPPFPHLNVYLFDSRGIGQGTSGIATGLLHPYAGAHAKLNRMGREGMQATRELLEVASQALRQDSIIAKNQGILRLALSQEQQSDFQYCAAHYSQDVKWLDVESCQKLAPGCAQVPGLWIPQGLTIDSLLYLQGLWQACRQLGAQFEQRLIHSLEEVKDFDLTFVTTGAESIRLPELSNLPLKIVKGQVLELTWPEDLPPSSCALNSHVYIVMTKTNNSCLVGATYEKGYQEAMIDLKVAQQQLLPKAYQLLPALESASVINCYAGLRAVTPQHLPWIQRLSSSQWILTGMGSKGLLYHALFAKDLVQRVWLDVFVV